MVKIAKLRNTVGKIEKIILTNLAPVDSANLLLFQHPCACSFLKSCRFRLETPFSACFCSNNAQNEQPKPKETRLTYIHNYQGITYK